MGSAWCGKSYYLASLIWTLRKLLPSSFGLSFNDADHVANALLIGYEENLFLRQDSTKLVALADLIKKTQTGGDLYNTVTIGDQNITYPRPFSFLLQPTQEHRRFDEKDQISRVVCLYDNAGEHFLPGADSMVSPGTRHLAAASFLLFLYDPMQDPRLIKAIQTLTGGKQVQRSQEETLGRQEAILQEAANRIRKQNNLAKKTKHDRPLIVLVTKADIFGDVLYGSAWSEDPVRKSTKDSTSILRQTRINKLSQITRDFLMESVPELVMTAEDFAHDVSYLPVSALGGHPSIDENGNAWIKPDEIQPRMVAHSFLYGLSLTDRNLVARSTLVPGNN